MTFEEWYTKERRVALGRLNMRKDDGRAHAEAIWRAAQKARFEELLEQNLKEISKKAWGI